MELNVGVQHYDWGKIGNISEVARLYKHDSCVSIDDSLPYAELWMGTHINCPSVIKSTGIQLDCYIKNNPVHLGSPSIERFGTDLPFLFKVLSIRKALSIQAHPDKNLAVQLHKEKPDLYKDPNHKPELAIALTPFKAMCGFRPFQEIQKNLKTVPELASLVGSDQYATFQGAKDQQTADTILPQLFRNLMLTSANELVNLFTIFTNRLKSTTNLKRLDLSDIILKLFDQFPNDVGCFAPLFLNVVNLQPGEAIFLGANEIHAYIEGDCIECMACSDNVVRAGLTPKLKDVETLCNMLNYRGAPHTTKLFTPVIENAYTKIFRPPVPDFAVAVTEIHKGETATLIPRTVASIAIFVEGYGHTHDDIVCTAGTILFIPANAEVGLLDVQENIVCYIGMANV